MNWHESIEYIREKPEYAALVEKAYFERDLALNVERFRGSEEFMETIKLINQFQPTAKSILEIGAGNGIAAINFALLGYQVKAVEPDSSPSIGAEAIQKLKEHYHLNNIEVFEKYAEEINFDSESFDLVYIRQAMHHAYDLKKFIRECGRVLKKGGILLTVRDHVVFDEQDKKWFLEEHPLHKFYGGENAFTELEYRKAIEQAGLNIELQLKHFESVINYFPLSKADFENAPIRREAELKSMLQKKMSFLAHFPPLFNWYKKRYVFSRESFWDERKVPGRMYSFIARK